MRFPAFLCALLSALRPVGARADAPVSPLGPDQRAPLAQTQQPNAVSASACAGLHCAQERQWREPSLVGCLLASPGGFAVV
jgi:hypothetical protein